LSDTADIVQDALLQTLRNIERFDDRGRGALQAYLRQAVTNRICDELRKVQRRPATEEASVLDSVPHGDPSPLQWAADAERHRRYKEALATLTPEEQLLVAGRLELDYTYDQLALISGRATADAARVAVRRAILKLAKSMSSG
jgi:RNA polymerase sigma-70 factor (ECF subfamily)